VLQQEKLAPIWQCIGPCNVYVSYTAP